MKYDYDTLIQTLIQMSSIENITKLNQLGNIKDTFYTDYTDSLEDMDSKQQKECENLILKTYGIRLNKLGKKIFLTYNDNIDITNTSVEEKELCNSIKKLLLDFEKKYIIINKT